MLTCLRTGRIVAGKMGPFMIGRTLGHRRILEKLRQSREGGWCMLLGER